ncbi:hypothetical protein HJFPF1_10214 [Paramyrothecium foliicola]|nr:hypothetical protein HJFPF1_10214 [Paramyrothecium foliicola]
MSTPLANLNTTYKLDHYEPQSAIGTKIRRQLATVGSSDATISFKLDWNPRRFIRATAGNDSLSSGEEWSYFKDVICLTGTLANAQGMTISEYMAQTWRETWFYLPTVTSELALLPLDEESLCAEHSSPSLPLLQARLTGEQSCSITLTGGMHMLVAIGEQIGWLAATLRHPPTSIASRAVFSCVPSLENLHKPSEEESFWSCSMVFHMTEVDLSGHPAGSCWTSLLQTPVLVGGYSILPRSPSNTGLEVKLNIVFQLLGSARGVRLGERVFIKAFGTILVVSKVTDDLVIWHLLKSDNPDVHISFDDPRLDKAAARVPTKSRLSDIIYKRRHIIEWSPQANDLCGEIHSNTWSEFLLTTPGQPGSNFAVERSGLPDQSMALVIERWYVEAGHYLILGGVISLGGGGRIERPEDFSYEGLVNWLSYRTILFYDVTLTTSLTGVFMTIRR